MDQLNRIKIKNNVLKECFNEKLKHDLEQFIGTQNTAPTREQIKHQILFTLKDLPQSSLIDFDLKVSKDDKSKIHIVPKNKFTEDLFNEINIYIKWAW